MTFGAGAGFLAGRPWGTAVWGCWLGAVVGITLHELRDSMRGRRLLRWLRDAQGTDPGSLSPLLVNAPRDGGRWGEIAYRVERLLRLRELALVEEKASLADFLSAIEASPNGVMLLDAQEHIVWCNSVAADHFGIDPARDRNQRVTNLLRAPDFVAYLQAAAHDDPITMRSPHGDRSLEVLIRGYGVGMCLVISQDITEPLRNEAMRRDFVANVSHEIRTPLTVLSGFVETLANLPLTDVERKRVLSLMTQQTLRMQSLVADLLALAQLEGSPRPSADVWVPVEGLLQQVETEALGLSKSRHTVVFPTLKEAGLQLAGSQTELQSALANLVSNAVRYTPEGGRVEVGCTQRPDGSCAFAVTDTGPGIAREHIPRLTERFYRVDGSRSRETGGTGLGLSIVKHIVQRHGAELQIDSEPGKGSTFRIVFPATRVAIRRGTERTAQARVADTA
jgi:two-component system phosphate regulon sensor histidine kinase PhoR